MIKNIYILFIFLFTLLSCHREQQNKKVTIAIPVRTVEVAYKKISKPIFKSGILFSDVEVKLSFKISGIIDSIYVEEAQEVKKGQLLAQLKLDEIKAQVQQAKSGLEKANRDYKRINNLYSDKVATLEQLQNAKTGLDVATSNYKIAKFNLKYAGIRSPGTGRILKILARQDELIGAGYPVFIFARITQKWNVTTGITDKDIYKLKTGDSATVQIEAIPDKIYNATISKIGAAPDPTTGLYDIELNFTSDLTSLKNGFFSRIRIFPSQNANYYIIPFESLVNSDGNIGYLFTVDKNNIAHKMKVDIAFISGENVALNTNLENLNNIVSVGAAFLSDGSKVKIENESN